MAESLTVVLAGFGNVGRDLAHRRMHQPIPSIALVPASARDFAKAKQTAGEIAPDLKMVAALISQAPFVVGS